MLNDEALNASEVADILHIGRNAVYDLAKSGQLPSYRIGRKLLFALRDVEAYLTSIRVGNVPPDAGQLGAGAAKSEASSEGETTLDTERPWGGAPMTDGTFVIAGKGTAADLVAERLDASGIAATRATLTSYSALEALYRGQVSAAVVHLYDQRTNTYNVPYVQRLAPGTPLAVFRLVRRRQGFIVAKGNPKGIGTWGALLRPDIRLANRERGCGSRVLLDEKLLAMEANGELIEGYQLEHATGLLAARAVASGAADVAVVGQQIAAQVADADFVPLQEEWLDLVVAKGSENVELMREVRSMLDDPGFKAEYGRIAHGDNGSFGSIIYEC